MDPGLTSFNQIINDSLMPWLNIFNDEKKLRKLIINISTKMQKDNNGFFKSLLENLEHSGIRVKDCLFNDWSRLSKTDFNYQPEILFIKSKNINWQNILVQLYFMLCINSALSHFYWLKENINNENDERLIKLKVMRSLKDSGQLIIDCNRTCKTEIFSDTIIDIARMMLAYVWLKILSIYHPYVHQEGLPLLKEEVMHNIIYRSDRPDNRDQLRELIMTDLNLQEEKNITKVEFSGQTTKKENNTDNIDDVGKLTMELASDMKIIKDGIMKFKIKRKAEYLQPKDARKLLNISNTTLNDWRKKGKIEDFHKNGNRFEYNKAELNNLKRHTNEQGRNKDKLP